MMGYVLNDEFADCQEILYGDRKSLWFWSIDNLFLLPHPLKFCEPKTDPNLGLVMAARSILPQTGGQVFI